MEGDSIRDFVTKFVEPMTRGKGMGIALLLNADAPLEVNLMISHCWDENALGFFDDLESNALESEVMFICFFSLYQNEDGWGPSIAEQLGTDIRAGPFAQVIKSFLPACGTLAAIADDEDDASRDHDEDDAPPTFRGRMLVVTNREVPLYSRLWCVWEVYNALAIDIPIDFTVRGELFDGCCPSCKFAHCDKPEDEQRIRVAIEQERINQGVDDPSLVDGSWRRSMRRIQARNPDLDGYKRIDRVIKARSEKVLDKPQPGYTRQASTMSCVRHVASSTTVSFSERRSVSLDSTSPSSASSDSEDHQAFNFVGCESKVDCAEVSSSISTGATACESEDVEVIRSDISI